jgi:hypothetical protein
VGRSQRIATACIIAVGASAATALALLAGLASPVVARAEGSDGVAPLSSTISYASCCDQGSTVAPVVTGLPAVSGGSGAHTVGMVVPLSCSQGTWAGSPPLSYSYRWLRNGVIIPGATEAAYSLQIIEEATTVACEVTASNQAGSAVARSASTGLSVLADERGQVQHGIKICGRFVLLGDPSAVIRVALLTGLLCSEKKRTESVRSDGGIPFEFATPAPGTVTAAWYKLRPAMGKAGRASTKPTLVAAGRASCPGPHGGAVVRLKAKLTALGEDLFKHAKRLHLVAKGTFTPVGGTPVTVTRHVLIRG